MVADRGELYAIAGVAGPLEVRVLVAGVANYRRDVGRSPILLCPSGIDPSTLVVQNLSVSPFEIGVDRGLTYGQGLQVPARSQWSPVYGVGSIWASPHYYDRNPLSVALSDNRVGIAPSSNAAVWTYTVPAGRRMQIESLACRVQRSTQATSAAPSASNTIAYTPSGGALKSLLLARIVTNEIGDVSSALLGSNWQMQPGDTIQDVVNDLASIAGTVDWFSTLKGTEYDA